MFKLKFGGNGLRVSCLSLVVVVVGAVMASGCSDPKSFEVAKMTESQRKELGQKLTAEEGQKLTGWMMRNALGGKEPPVGFTVDQALKAQDDWIAQEKEAKAQAEELKKRIEAERKAKQEEFGKLLSVAVVAKKNSSGDYGQRMVLLDVAFQNKGDKDIAGVKSTLRIADMFGDKIINLGWSFDEGVAAGKTSLDSGSGMKINQFMNDHMKLWNTDLDKLKITIDIRKIIFKDGTSIDSPE